MDEKQLCGNCHIEMHKELLPIVFSPNPPTRTWWKCPKCGAHISRQPDKGELDSKYKDYSLKLSDIKPPDWWG